MFKQMKRFWCDERGIESVEWALILGIIVLVAVTAAVTAKESMRLIFDKMNSALEGARP